MYQMVSIVAKATCDSIHDKSIISQMTQAITSLTKAEWNKPWGKLIKLITLPAACPTNQAMLHSVRV